MLAFKFSLDNSCIWMGFPQNDIIEFDIESNNYIVKNGFIPIGWCDWKSLVIRPKENSIAILFEIIPEKQNLYGLLSEQNSIWLHLFIEEWDKENEKERYYKIFNLNGK